MPPIASLALGGLLGLAALAQPGCAHHPATATATAPSPPPPRVLATVDGQAIDEAAVSAHAARYSIASREEALSDLIDLRLLTAAAARAGVPVPDGALSSEQRHGVEYRVGRSLGLDLPPATVSLVVDHAWVKDAPRKGERAANRKAIEAMRVLVQGGATVPAAYQQQHGLDGTMWHIGDHETYSTSVLPAPTHGLQPGAVSDVIAGDGGLHLFRVFERLEQLPEADRFAPQLKDRLRDGAKVELAAPAAP